MSRRFLLPALILIAACAGPAREPVQESPSAPVVQTAPAEVPAQTTPDDGRPRLRPVDTAAEDPTFVAYRRQLLAAVEAKDTGALEKLVDPKIRTSFGNGGGWADFLKRWKLPSSDSELWRELETILRMGGSFAGPPEARRFCAPYVYSNWPEEKDPFEHLAVIDENVPLLERAADDVPAILTMDYEIVKSLDHDFNKPWRQIELADGKKGWVRSDKVRSSIQYRACFQKPGGEWMMNLLVAGD